MSDPTSEEQTGQPVDASQDGAPEHAGLPDPDDLDQATLDKLEEERQQRLDPENRPDNVEVDNTQRTFDPEPDVANFTDAESYDGDLAAGERPGDRAEDAEEDGED